MGQGLIGWDDDGVCRMQLMPIFMYAANFIRKSRKSGQEQI